MLLQGIVAWRYVDLDCVDIVLRGGVMWSDWEERRASSRLRSLSSLRCPCAPSPVRKREKAPSGGLPLPQARQLRSEGNSFGFLPRLFHLACQGKSKPPSVSASPSLSPSPLYLFLLLTLSILSVAYLKSYLLMCFSELLMEMYQNHKYLVESEWKGNFDLFHFVLCDPDTR